MVELSVDGMACELRNARLALRMGADGKAVSCALDGRDLMSNLSGAAGDPDRTNSFYCDYHVNGKTRNLTPTRLEVLADAPDLAHVAYVDDESDLGLSYHLVLRGDEPIVYGYVIASCDVPGTVINELRTVYRFDSRLFTTGHTKAREGMQPLAEDMAENGAWLQDETYLLADGTRYTNSNVYSKYDYAGYFSENELWGQYSGGRGSDEWGAWFIPLDKSCYPTGPLKQELLVHYDAIILNYMTGAHFGTGDFEVPCGWRKLYGPWAVYFNRGERVVDDAYERAEAERLALPPSWLKEPGLYAGSYAGLRGSLELAAPLDHPRGWTVVAADEPGDYFEQKAGRIYYDAAVCDDRFALTGMQPGRYWLHARMNGTSDACEYDLGAFEVAAGECLDAGTLLVDNRELPSVWQLGYSTGTTEPFAFWDQPRNYVWSGLTPQNLTFTIGENSDQDWYYLQRAGGSWKICFARPDAPAEDAPARYLLTVCLAGTTAIGMAGAKPTVAFSIALNGKGVARRVFDTDRAAYRSSVTGGRPQVIEVELDAADLRERNSLAFTTTGYVMYDMVKLEVLS